MADWAVLCGAVVLFASLFLAWSRQYPSSVGSLPGMSVALRGVPANATAWQVYSVADVLLAALAATLVGATALGRGRGARALMLAACGVALAFVIHALGNAPTSGADVVIPGSTQYVSSLARSGPGEPVAIGGLAGAIAGLALSLPAW